MSLLSVPLKTVLMYHADLQNEAIPESYAVCDGTVLSSGQQDINPGSTYTLPDLRNRFILGADITKAAGTTGGTTNAANDGPGPKGVGGQHSKALILAELPIFTVTGTVDSAGSHSHTGTAASAGSHVHAGSSTSTAGAHVHSITDPGHYHTVNVQANAISLAGGGPGYTMWPTDSPAPYRSTNSATTGISIQSNGDHTHTLSIASDGSHTHTIATSTDGAHQHTFTSNSIGGNTAFDTRPRYYGLVFIMKVKI